MPGLPLNSRLFSLLTLAAAACNPPQTATAPPVQAPAPDTPVSSLEPRSDLRKEEGSPDLFGAWIIERAAAAGRPVGGYGWDMILLVGNRHLEVLSQCVIMGPFDYRRTTGGGIVVSQPSASSRPSPEAAGPAPAPVRCARTLSPAERWLPPVLFAARDVERRADGTVHIVSNAGELVLRRPSGALRNPLAQAPAPRVPPLLGAWRVAAVDGRSLGRDERVEVLLRPGHIEWRSGCVNELRQLRRDDDRLLPGAIEPLAVCERAMTESERTLGRLLEGPVATKMSSDGRLKLDGSGVTAELEPLTN